MLDTTTNDTVTQVLDTFGQALARGDIDAAVSMFQADCYWRDLVSFTWNLRTMEGQDQVRDMLGSQLAATKPTGWKIADGEVATEEGGVTTAWITFETGVARGYGLIRLQDGMAQAKVGCPGLKNARKNRRNWATRHSPILLLSAAGRAVSRWVRACVSSVCRHSS